MTVRKMAGRGRGLAVFLLLLPAYALAQLLCLNSAHAFDVTLSWDANTETNLAGYKIYYGTTRGGPYLGSGSDDGVSPILVPVNTLTNKASPEFTVHGLPDGTNYLVITAYNIEGLESGYSNEVRAQAPNAPAAPPNSAPVLSSLEVNGHAGSSEVYTNTRSVAVRVVASDDTLVSQYLILDGKSDPNGGTFLPLPGGPRQNPIFTVSGVALNDTEGNHAIYAWVRDEHGLVSSMATKTNVILERTPSVAVFPVLNPDDSSITISYSESGMRNAALSGNYSLNNGLLLRGDGTDASGNGRVFKFPLDPGTLQRYVIYTIQIGGGIKDSAGNAVTPSTFRVNDDDNDGMADDWERRWFGSITAKNGSLDSDADGLPDRVEYEGARQKSGQWARWWELNPTRGDSDEDGIPDKYEVDHSLNPVDHGDGNQDLDGDGWTNRDEYLAGYSANNANSPAPAPPQIREVIPERDGPVPGNSAFAVRLEAMRGINIHEPSAVTLTINDGSRIYKRSLNDTNANGAEVVKAVPLEPGVSNFRDLWIVYYRSNETDIPGQFQSGGAVQITVEATDLGSARMPTESFAFRIQTDSEEREEGQGLPHLVTVTDDPAPGLTSSRVVDKTSELHGAAIIYESFLPSETGIVPYLGPSDAVPKLNTIGHGGVGLPMNLLPPSVFPGGVTLLIPCPGYRDVSSLSLFYYNGASWVLACDPAGNVQEGGVGWMVPGSRVNHNSETLSYIQIDVYHFSAVTPGYTSRMTMEMEGGGCFIGALGRQ